MEQSSPLESEIVDGVLKLTKNNPDSSFGISLAMWEALTGAMDRAEQDDAIRAVVIDAAGKGFHRGAVMVAELKPSMEELGKADFRHLVQMGQALGRQIAALPKPVIGIARGGALGGGLELLLRSDFIYTTHQAQFSFPEVTLGFVAAWGGTQWGGRTIALRRAQEMLLLGEPVTGRRAEEINLVTRSFESDKALYDYVESVLERLKFCSPASFASTKACLSALWEGPLEYGERVEMEEETAAMATGDFLKGLSAWAEGNRYNYDSDEIVSGDLKYEK